MRLTQNDIQFLFKLAVETALRSGEIINSYRDTTFSIHSKNSGRSLAGDVVTEVDTNVQNHIESALEEVCHRYDLGFLGEERGDDQSRLDCDYFWSIDPIDGTLAFCEGREGYSVSIGLVRLDASPIIGVIYDPFNNRLYSAASGEGVFIDHIRMSALPENNVGVTNNDYIRCFLDRSYVDDDRYPSILKSLEQYANMNNRKIQIIAKGGAALNACWILDKTPALYFKLPKKYGGSFWDYAASAAIFKELGAPASDIYGNVFDLNRLDSTFMNHRGIIYASGQSLADCVIEAYNR